MRHPSKKETDTWYIFGEKNVVLQHAARKNGLATPEPHNERRNSKTKFLFFVFFSIPAILGVDDKKNATFHQGHHGTVHTHPQFSLPALTHSRE